MLKHAISKISIYLSKLYRYVTKKRTIVKKRVVFALSSDEELKVDLPESKVISIKIYKAEEFNKNKYDLILGRILSPYKFKRYSKRIMDPRGWHIVIAYHGDEPAGCLWFLDINSNNFKFDSFIHDENQILWGSSFVVPDYRGNKIHNRMKVKAHEYIQENYSNKTIVSIVEAQNTSSMRSNTKLGAKVLGHNYLVKFLDFNILSIVDSGKDISERNVFFLPKYKQYKW